MKGFKSLPKKWSAHGGKRTDERWLFFPIKSIDDLNEIALHTGKF